MSTCQTALKEWAVLVDALRRGDQLLLLRKGGILDVGGEFHLETPQFVLWPTYLHQESDWLGDAHKNRLGPVLAQPRGADEYRLDTFAEVTEILTVPRREALDELGAEHIWSPVYLDLRWSYRPELPLYLLLLRVQRLPQAVVAHETSAQRGCRSWVALDDGVSLDGGEAAVDAAAFEQRTTAIRAALAG